MPPVEDMIADRLGQYCANPSGHSEMLDQAVVLYDIATSSVESRLDEAYLDARILKETLGTYGLGFLKEQLNGADHS